MRFHEHYKRSLEDLKENDLSKGICQLKPKLIYALIQEIHLALDEASPKNGTSDEKLKAREILHHREGIENITRKIANEYGQDYEDLIRHHAEMHVRDDIGYIPNQEEYKKKYFWPKWKFQNEVQYHWM